MQWQAKYRLGFCLSFLTAVACLPGFAGAAWAASDDYPGASSRASLLVSPRDVKVQRDGDQFHVDAVMVVPVSPAMAWQVLIDFGHMTRFMPNLGLSEVLPGADALHFTVHQKGMAKFGLFSKSFDSTRAITLQPEQQRITARNLDGNLKAMQSVMTLSADGAGTRLEYHADVEPGFWLPPLVGPSAVQRQTAEQFSAMIEEMLRRAGKADTEKPR